MNGLDFFFSPSATSGNNGEDDEWGEFVDSSPRISPNPIGFSADHDCEYSTTNQIASEKMSTSRSPVPLSVFGEEEDEDEDESGAPVSSFNFSFDTFSGGKHNDGPGSVSRVVNTNQTVGINDLIANLYIDKVQNDGVHMPENNLKTNGVSHALYVDLPRSLSIQKIENSAVRLDNLNWNPLNLDRERSEGTSNVVNSITIGVPNSSDLAFPDKFDDDDDDGWEFKAAQSIFPKEEHENAKTGSVVQIRTTLSSSVSTSPTNGTRPNFDTGKMGAVKSFFDQDNGDDDSWVNGEWEFKVAEAGEPENNSTHKESNGWGFGSDIEPVSQIETTTSFQSNFEKEMQNRDDGSFSFPSHANVNFGGTSWAFKQPSSETGNEKEEKKMQTEKPKEVLPLSFFEDEKLGTLYTFVHEDNFVSPTDFSVREKTKAPSPTVSFNDLISSLYSQVEGKHAVNLSGDSDGFGFASAKAATDSNFVNECVDEFDDDSWEFQGPTQPVRDMTSRKGDNGSWESKLSSMDNEVGNQFSVTDGFGDLPEKPVTSIEPNDFKDFFNKLKTELYYIALNHLEALKEARDLAADSNEDAEVRKCDGDIMDLQNWLNNDALISEVNVESLQPRSSGITELSKALQELKFRALDSEDLLSERLLLVEKDWKSTIELLKHATLTLKILNLGLPEQQAKYASTWFVIASTCAQELQHAASIWKQVIKNDVQEETLSTPQGKRSALSVREIYRVVKILRASTRLYRPWILLAPISYNVMAVLDECVKLWLSSGLEEAIRKKISHQGLDGVYSADHLLESIEVDTFRLQTCIGSATSPVCYISGLSAEIVPGIKMVEWKGEHYLVPLANLWANLISHEPPSLPGLYFPISL